MSIIEKLDEFRKSLVFPQKQSSIGEKFEAFVNRKLKDTEIEFAQDYYAKIRRFNLKAILAKINETISIDIDMILNNLAGIHPSLFYEQVEWMTSSLHASLKANIMEMVESEDFEPQKIQDFIREKVHLLVQKVLALNHYYCNELRFQIASVDNAFGDWVKEQLQNSCSDLELFISYYKEWIDAKFGKEHWMIPYKVQAMRESIVSQIQLSKNRLKDSYASQIKEFISVIHAGKLSLFDPAFCTQGLGTFRELCLKNLGFLSDIENEIPLYYTSVPPVDWSLVPFDQKLFLILSLMLVCTKVFKLLLSGRLDSGDYYPAHYRYKIKALVDQMYPANFYQGLEQAIFEYLSTFNLSSQLLYLETDMNLSQIVQELERQTNRAADKITPKLKLMSFELLNRSNSFGITIFISGWLSEEDNYHLSWEDMQHFMYPMNALALRWSASSNKSSDKQNPASTTRNPIKWVSKMVGVATNAFGFYQSRKRAKKTGRILALILKNRILGNRVPVSLIGFSLGTQVIISCLKELAKCNEKLIEDVVLLGSAANYDQRNLLTAREATSGRFINVFSKYDFALQRAFRAATRKIALGTTHAHVPGIIDFDASSIVKGHVNYRKNLNSIFQALDY